MPRVSFHDISDIPTRDYLQPFLAMLRPPRFSPEFTSLLKKRVASITQDQYEDWTGRRESYGAQRTPEPPRVLMERWIK